MTKGSSTTNSITVTTTTTTGGNLASTGDVENHDFDVFLVWLNPVLNITQPELGTLTLNQMSGINGFMDVMSVTAGQLKNGIPDKRLEDRKVCPQQQNCFTVPGLHVLSAADKAALLGMDTFLSWGPTDAPTTMAPSRYLYIQTNALENLTDSGGFTPTLTIDDTQSISKGIGSVTGGSSAFSVGSSFDLGGIGTSSTAKVSWTWSVNVAEAQISGTAQTATVNLSSNTAGCCANNSGNGVSVPSFPLA
ncbi:MAG TPA: hypothetical protein VGR71_13585 [Nitrospira sp.]|nr:hypothetical protein [Nitrospira sp.]